MALATERQAASGPIVSLPERFNIADYLVDRHVREGRGGRTAILCGEQSITYAQIADRSIFEVKSGPSLPRTSVSSPSQRSALRK